VSEYIVTITVQRSARSEGDTPVVAITLSEAVHPNYDADKADVVAGVVARLGDRIMKDLRENGMDV
jgi:hypothetical protein